MERRGSVSTCRTCACCDFRAKPTEDKSTWTKMVTKDEAVEKLRHWVQQQDPAFKKQFLNFSKDLDGRVNWYNFRKVGRASVFVSLARGGRLLCHTTRCQGVALGFLFSDGQSRSRLGLSAEEAPLGQCRRPLSAEKASDRRPRCPRGQMGWDQASQAPRCMGSARCWGCPAREGGRRAGKEPRHVLWALASRPEGPAGRVCIDSSETSSEDCFRLLFRRLSLVSVNSC